MTKICAVFVTFNPEKNLIKNIEAIKSQVEQIIVIDNASSGAGLNYLKQIEISDPTKIQIIYNKYNLGIATALNQGCHRAIQSKIEWIITFDQDSFAEANFVETLFAEYNKTTNQDQIAILAPIPFDQTTGFSPKPYCDLKEGHIVADSVITSGSLIKLSAVQKVGFFDDNFFIDYVDHDFCLKLRKFGYRLLLVPKARLAHNYGNPKLHRCFGFSFFTHNYPPKRRYYLARNRVVAYKRHRKILKWIAHDSYASLKDICKIIFVEANKIEKFKAIILGTIDGLLGRMGNVDGFTYSMPKPEKYFVEWRQEIIPLLPDSVNKMMDLGCGAGETSFQLKKRGYAKWVCGIEGNPKAAEIAREKLDLVIEGDIEKLDWSQAQGPFDVILALDILEHLVDPWAVVEKLSENLSPQGVIITSLPNIQHYSTVFPLVCLGDWRYSEEGLLDSTHLRFFTRKTAIQLMTSTGLQLEEVSFTGMRSGSISYLFNVLTLGIFKNFFVYQYLLKVQKKND
jgi:rhamnosyltransferase